MQIRHILAALALMAGTAAQAQQSIPYVAPQAEMLPYQNPSLTPQQRAEDLCQRLTLEEKARIMMNGSGAILDQLYS